MKFIENDHSKLKNLEYNNVPSYMKSTKSIPSFLEKNKLLKSSNKDTDITKSNDRHKNIDIPHINIDKVKKMKSSSPSINNKNLIDNQIMKNNNIDIHTRFDKIN